MNSKFFISSMAALSLGLASTTFANTVNNTEYVLVAYKNCQPVLTQALNQEQMLAHLALQDAETEFTQRSAPLKKLELITKQFESRIKQAEQDQNYAELGRLGQQMEREFQQLEVELQQVERQGHELERRAHRLERAIEPSLAGIKHDNIQIIPAGQTPSMCS
ncbi:hypothetical protein ACFOEE_00160 [Pseudoalteromonas fenneropenaei]|uniref:OmpH family outer membrane protein n=1 Tax=Pseudoalteromonas fenneropenaei TaxID=1737459 RepID=A0ABV7CCC1_9GAMM